MMHFPVLLSTILVVSEALNYSDIQNGRDWKNFKIQYNKRYANRTVEDRHMRNFLENKKKIAEHNENFEKGEVSFKMALNQFGDLSHEDFLTEMWRPPPENIREWIKGTEILGKDYVSSGKVQLPNAVDWREKGAVSPVKNQGTCGSCWSFSATGAIESYYLKKGINVSLSQQNLLDCAQEFGTYGCRGGFRDFAFKYIIDNGGINTAESYPYEGKIGDCRYNASNIGATINSFVKIPPGDEESLKDALATVGPVGVAMDASHESLRFYSSGVYYDAGCNSSSRDINHDLLAVGYGTEEGDDYWILKNSWGKSWGDGGYFKISTKDMSCGVPILASYPVITGNSNGRIQLKLTVMVSCIMFFLRI